MFEQKVRVGSIGAAKIRVTKELTAIAMGSGSVDAYATPAMLALMEAASVSAIDPNLTKGHISVGTDIAVRHIVPTPVGEEITAMAEITRIDGIRITLEARAWDEHDMIGIGTIVRYLIKREDFIKRMKD
jgi:fluoroacetyl-CoA thioesterase